MFFSLKAVLISSDLDGNHPICCSDCGGGVRLSGWTSRWAGVAWRAMARRAPNVPLHIRLRERMHESRLSWIDFLHEHTQKRSVRGRGRQRNKGAAERNGARMMKRNTPQQDCRVRAEAERADHQARGEYDRECVECHRLTAARAGDHKTSLAGSKTLV